MDTTGATLLVAVVSSYNGYNQVLTDSVGTRDWSTAQEYDIFGTGGGPFNLVLYKPAPVTSASYTFSIPAQPGLFFQSATVWACSGTATDVNVMTAQTGLATSGSSTSWQPGALTPQQTGDLLFVAGTSNTNSATATIDSGYSTPVINTSTGYMASISTWQSAASTTPVNPTWTTNQPTWTGTQVLFRAAGNAPPTSSGGVITNFAGTGRMDYGGDAGAATNAYFFYPGQIVKTSAGLICLADVNNNRIRCINPTGASITAYGKTIAAGNIDTIAGSGTLGFLDGALLSAQFAHPVGLAIDAADCMYIADQQNARVRKFCPAGTVSTVAGGGTGGAVVNGCGTLPTGGFAGDGGAATSALLACPQGVAVDANGNVVIADSDNYRIRAVNVQATSQTLWGHGICAGCIQTVAGVGAGSCAITGSTGLPVGLMVDSGGSIVATSYGCNRIAQVSTSGVITFPVGSGIAGYAGDGGAASGAQLRNPFDVRETPNGDMYIADTGNSVIRFVNHATGTISTVGGNYPLYPYNANTFWHSGGYCCDTNYATLAGLMYPIGLYIDPTSSRLYISDLGNSRVRSMGVTLGGGGGPAVGGVLIAASVTWMTGSTIVGATSGAPTAPIYGGVGTPGANSTVTLAGSSAVLSTGDQLPQIKASPEVAGDSWSFSPSNQVIYLLLIGGSHTFVDQNNAPFPFNAPLTVNLNGVTMFLYQSQFVQALPFTIKVAS